MVQRNGDVLVKVLASGARDFGHVMKCDRRHSPPILNLRDLPMPPQKANAVAKWPGLGIWGWNGMGSLEDENQAEWG